MAVQCPRLIAKEAVALVAGCLLWTSAGPVVHAQDEEPPTLLDKITISSYATRSPQPTFDVPALISQVETDAPGNALAGDVADLLEFTPGVEVDNGPRRNGQTISIRGFDDEAIITLIDGRRQNCERMMHGMHPTVLERRSPHERRVQIVAGGAPKDRSPGAHAAGGSPGGLSAGPPRTLHYGVICSSRSRNPTARPCRITLR